MAEALKRNRLTPWYIALVIVIGAVAFLGYRMYATACPAPAFVEMVVLAVIPAIYLVLMYLTFISQK